MKTSGPSAVSPVRRVIFFRLQFISYTLLIFAIVCGFFFIEGVIADAEARRTIELVFAMVALLTASSQAIVNYATISASLSPLQRFLRTVGEAATEIRCEDAGADRRIKEQVANLKRHLKGQAVHSTEEMRIVTQVVVQLLAAVETSWTKQSADGVLVALGTLCSQVAHDMRSPLATMMTFLKCLPTEYFADKEMADLKNAAQRSCSRLHQMAEELLDHKRSGQIERKSLDMAKVLRSVCDELNVIAKTKDVTINVGGALSVDYFGDEPKLARTFQNLCQNAIQAMEACGERTLDVSLNASDGEIAVCIEDTGRGIPVENIDKIFLPTFTTKGAKGTGLGLAYCKNVINAHGGRITVENREEGGARFSILLPVQTIQ